MSVRFVVVVACLLASTAIAGAQGPKPGQGAAPPPAAGKPGPAVPGGAQPWRSPNGMTLNLPASWTAGPAREQGWVQVSGPAGEGVVIGPVFIDGPLTPQQAQAILAQHVARRPALTWSAPRAVGAQAVQSIGRGAGATAATTFVWTPAGGGTAGMFFVAGAPDAQYGASAATMAAILASMRLAGPGGAADAPGGSAGMQFVTWMEPNEHGFTIEVPAGWQASGGMVRRFLVDLRAGVTLRSPDGQVTAFVGDAELPPFATPMPGFAEGSLYVPQGTVQYMVAQFRPGVAFAAEYAQRRFARECGRIAPTRQEDHRGIAAQVNAANQNPAARMAGVENLFSLGHVEFTCGALAGIAVAGTQIAMSRELGGGTWSVPVLYGYLAPPARAAEAGQVLARVAASLRVDPAWAQRNGQMVGAAVGIQRQTSQHVFDIIQGVNRNRQQAAERGSAQWDEYIRMSPGTLVDPQTGRAYSVWSTSQYNWIDQNGNVTATNTPAWQGAGQTQLVPVD